ncbi:hypothetical protein GS937_04120 [Rhodococcus hoagii]|nr:hypothetical protein [Prescottella equi]
MVDGVSWRVIVPDLAAAWAQSVDGRRPELDPVGTSMRRWAYALRDTVSDRMNELSLWEDVVCGADPPIGRRHPDPDRTYTRRRTRCSSTPRSPTPRYC